MDEKRLIIHAGLPKTGTTSIQRFLGANRDQLAQLGVFVPKVAYFDSNVPKRLQHIVRPDNHVLLISQIDPRDTRRQILADAGCEVRFRSLGEIAAEARNGDFDKILISHESIARRHHRLDFEKLYSCFPSAKPAIKLTLRRPVDFLNSMVAQSMRNRRRFRAPASEHPEVKKYLKVGFAGLIEGLERSCGQETVSARWFEDLIAGGDIEGAFLSWAGMDAKSIADTEWIDPGFSNPTPDASSLALMIAMDDAALPEQVLLDCKLALDEHREARRGAGAIVRSAHILEPKLVEQIRIVAARDYRVLEDRYGLSAPANDAALPLVEADDIGPATARRTFDAISNLLDQTHRDQIHKAVFASMP